jgi:hypothetical protein
MKYFTRMVRNLSSIVRVHVPWVSQATVVLTIGNAGLIIEFTLNAKEAGKWQITKS